MARFGDASPHLADAIELRTQLNESLKNSLLYILERYSHSGYDLHGLGERIAALDTRNKFSGLIHTLHDRLVHAAQVRDVPLAREILLATRELTFEAGPTRISGWYVSGPPMAWHQYYFDACDESFRRTYGQPFDGQCLSGQELDFARVEMERALEVLSDIDHDAYLETEAYLSDIFIFQSPTMNAATSMSALGIVRVSQLRPGQNWTRYLENIVHEVGHHHLNFLMAHDRLLINESQDLFKSPLRREARPLSGILHALFVLGRTLRLKQRFERSVYFDPAIGLASHYNNAQNAASFEEKFEDCWDTLKAHGQLTPLGRELMESTREMAFGRVSA